MVLIIPFVFFLTLNSAVFGHVARQVTTTEGETALLSSTTLSSTPLSTITTSSESTPAEVAPLPTPTTTIPVETPPVPSTSNTVTSAPIPSDTSNTDTSATDTSDSNACDFTVTSTSTNTEYSTSYSTTITRTPKPVTSTTTVYEGTEYVTVTQTSSSIEYISVARTGSELPSSSQPNSLTATTAFTSTASFIGSTETFDFSSAFLRLARRDDCPCGEGLCQTATITTDTTAVTGGAATETAPAETIVKTVTNAQFTLTTIQAVIEPVTSTLTPGEIVPPQPTPAQSESPQPAPSTPAQPLATETSSPPSPSGEPPSQTTLATISEAPITATGTAIVPGITPTTIDGTPISFGSSGTDTILVIGTSTVTLSNSEQVIGTSTAVVVVTPTVVCNESGCNVVSSGIVTRTTRSPGVQTFSGIGAQVSGAWESPHALIFGAWMALAVLG